MVTMQPYKTEFDDQFGFGSSSIAAALNPKVSNDGVTSYGNQDDSLQLYYGTGHAHSKSISSDSGTSMTGIELPPRSHLPVNYIPNVSHTYASTIPRQRGQRRDGYRVVDVATPSRTRDLIPLPNIPVKHESPGSGYDEDEEEMPEPPDEDATEEEKAAYKRRKNTLSARRSRKRKVLQMEDLQDTVTKLTREKNEWKERALTMERWLQHHKIPVPNFEGM